MADGFRPNPPATYDSSPLSSKLKPRKSRRVIARIVHSRSVVFIVVNIPE